MGMIDNCLIEDAFSSDYDEAVPGTVRSQIRTNLSAADNAVLSVTHSSILSPFCPLLARLETQIEKDILDWY